MIQTAVLSPAIRSDDVHRHATVATLEWVKAAGMAGSLLSLRHCVLGGAFMFMHMQRSDRPILKI